MKKLLLLLILSFLSTQSLAKVGDVYYCEITQYVVIYDDRFIEVWNRVGTKFKFKREKDKLARKQREIQQNPRKALRLLGGSS